jgi:hypothetical protein
MTSQRWQIHGGGLASHGSQEDGGVCSEDLLMEKWMRAQSMRSLQLSAADLEI